MDARTSWEDSVRLSGKSATASAMQLNEGWQLLLTEAGQFGNPVNVASAPNWIPALVPGTVAQALEEAGQFDRSNPRSLDDVDAWYILDLRAGTGEAVLRFEGLATAADVYLNDQMIFQSKSMFVSHDVAVDLTGRDVLAICFRAMGWELKKKGPRARWRPQLAKPAGLRLHRTTLLGRMPGWCPEVHAVGPWRPVSILRKDLDVIENVRLSTVLDEDGCGHLSLSLDGAPEGAPVQCAGRIAKLCDGKARLNIPGVEPWWPHTHGAPATHHVTIEVNGETRKIGDVGFRRIEVDHGADGNGFGLKINGVPVFCRGAVWTNADIVRLPEGEADYRHWLEMAVCAGMNMIRVSGTMVYESNAFYRLCDELGIMVWQEAMLANFDYPVADEEWLSLLKQEIEQFLKRTEASPSIAVFCGGSEVHQQAAMLGLPKDIYEGPLTGEIIPELVAKLRPDCVYVPNSPSGGAMPFSPNAGVTHYYGVGAYRRPLEDARRADVRFAAECLAFANVPEQVTLDQYLPVPPVHDPRWKARVPRDGGAGWDFDDVRDYYLKLLYDVDPVKLRYEDMGRYLDLSRAVTGEVIEATYSEWRRPGSSCSGALMWTYQDLMPGAGWGLVDSTGLPKPAWHAARRAFKPVQITLTDEGTNGLDVHVINELEDGGPVIVELTCLRDGKVPVVSGKREISLAPRSSLTIAATDLFDAFFDTTYAFRFGPPSHDVTVGRLINARTGEKIASSFHFPLGRATARHAAELSAELKEDKGWVLDVATDRLAQNVIIEVPGFMPADNWFHLAPLAPRPIRLLPNGGDVTRKPSGTVRLPGSQNAISF